MSFDHGEKARCLADLHPSEPAELTTRQINDYFITKRGLVEKISILVE